MRPPPRARLKEQRPTWIAGGDTAGRVGQRLGVRALQVAKSIYVAGPLCYAYSDVDEINGLELVFKGGQVGGIDFFGAVEAARIPALAEAALGNL